MNLKTQLNGLKTLQLKKICNELNFKQNSYNKITDFIFENINTEINKNIR